MRDDYWICTVCCYSTTSELKAEKHSGETGHDVELVELEDEE